MANNPYINKVVLGQAVLLDLTADTVAADSLLAGVTAHDRSGAAVTGAIQSLAAQTYTPGVADQAIPAGRYLAGAQTIPGDANLVAANIRAGASIFGVTGTMTGAEAMIYTGTAAPAAGLGLNGDVYLMTAE